MIDEPEVIEWLLNGDPAIRWQTQKDILSSGPRVYQKERLKIAKKGWGNSLLQRQDPEGTWAGGIYTPKWTSTTYTMMLLRQLGLNPGNLNALKACRLFLERGFYTDGGINFWSNYKHSETCVTGMILSLVSYFKLKDKRIPVLAEHLLDEQMVDGGWNCRKFSGAHHSSLHTTISVLEGLMYFVMAYPGLAGKFSKPVGKAHEFILMHRLFKSDKTGKIIDPKFTRLPFPPQWHYDILRCLDYFRAVKAERDERMADAVDLLINKRLPGGKWPLHQPYSGKTFFAMEPVGKPSRWNTLRALRVLKWWTK